MILSTRTPYEHDGRFLLPVRPNWRAPVRESYEFKTDIITSHNGKEQRRAVRDTPRKSISFEAALYDSWRLRFNDFLVNWQSRPTVLPDFPKYVDAVTSLIPLPDPEAAKPLSISFGGTRPDWLKPGVEVVLYTDEIAETRVVANASVSTIEFTEGNDSTIRFPRISPAMTGMLGDTITSRRLTNSVASLNLDFEVDPGSLEFEDGQPYETLAGREFLAVRPNWAEAVQLQNVSPRDRIDYGFGRIATFRPVRFPTQVRRLAYIGRSHAEVRAAIAFFYRMRGRRSEFLSPTWEDDIPYFAMPGNSFAITLAGQAFGHVYQGSSVYRRLAIRHADGRITNRMIDEIVPLADTDASTIVLREPLPGELLNRDTVFGVSWVLASRLASDRLDIDWLHDSVAQYSLSIQSLENFEL